MSEITGPVTSHEFDNTNRTEFKFVFSEHTVKFADKISPHLADCDVIAFEDVGSARELLDDNADNLTQYLAADADPAFCRDMEWWGKRADSFVYKVLLPLKGSNKKVVFVDVSLDDPEFQICLQSDDAVRVLDKTVTKAPLETTLANISNFVRTTAASNVAREALVASQLQVLAVQYPNSKVGVVLGSIHTPVYHRLSKQFATDRMFVTGCNGAKPGQLERYDYALQAIRQLRFNITEDTDPDLINAAAISLYRDIMYGVNMPNVEAIDGLTSDEKIIVVRELARQVLESRAK